VTTIGLRLKQERVRIGLSQRELGHYGGVATNAQGMYENGKRLPRADYLSKIMAAGIDVLYVLTGKPAPPSHGQMLDGITAPLDSVFDTYSIESDLLGKSSGTSSILTGDLQSFCKNHLTIIAAIKYLAILAEDQGYNDTHERVRAALGALTMNASIIAKTISRISVEDRTQGEAGEIRSAGID